jgi:hypothetical protein
VERKSAHDSSGLPPVLVKATPPREVRVNALGATMLCLAGALVVGGMWGGVELSRRAETASRHISLFESQRIVAAGDVIQLRRRGGGNDHRITAHYRYTARGRELTGQTTLRRDERDRYVVGSPIAVWYLASEPDVSWLDGYSPRPQASWPATAVPLACGVSALALIWTVRRQSNLLTYGRPAMASVTKVQRKRTDKGTIWMVHYEFTTMSGATRTGKYNHGKKHLPAVGTMMPILYDRDNTFRHSKYPMPFVSVKESGK